MSVLIGGVVFAVLVFGGVIGVLWRIENQVKMLREEILESIKNLDTKLSRDHIVETKLALFDD